MKIDWDIVPDAGGTNVPEGYYTCRLQAIQEGKSKDGSPQWTLGWRVVEGEHAGGYIEDRLTFSEAGLSRVKLLCSRVGIDVNGTVDLEPSMLIGRHVQVIVAEEEYQGKRRVKVPFDGYARTSYQAPEPEPTPEPKPEASGDLPAEACPTSYETPAALGIDESEIPF